MGTFLLVVMAFGEGVVYNRGNFGRKKGTQGARFQGLLFGGGAADGNQSICIPVLILTNHQKQALAR
jgi:hypothetical protein